MGSEPFKDKVKRQVAGNFDQSCRIYQVFEEKHRFFSALALKLAQAIHVTPGSSVLDVGCGNGASALALHDQLGCKIRGVDLSPKMVSAGRLLCGTKDIRLDVGDGEHLVRAVSGETFDYVLYNASLFIFPDVSQTIAQAYDCLRPGGKVAFSFYPQLTDAEGNDLLALAFRRLGMPLPRYRVITDYDKACQALSSRFGNIRHHRWERPLDVEFMTDFFSIPAQSASLFPGRAFTDRRDGVKRLFGTLEAMNGQGLTVWRMAESTKP